MACANRPRPFTTPTASVVGRQALWAFRRTRRTPWRGGTSESRRRRHHSTFAHAKDALTEHACILGVMADRDQGHGEGSLQLGHLMPQVVTKVRIEARE